MCLRLTMPRDTPGGAQVMLSLTGITHDELSTSAGSWQVSSQLPTGRFEILPTVPAANSPEGQSAEQTNTQQGKRSHTAFQSLCCSSLCETILSQMLVHGKDRYAQLLEENI